MTKKQKINPRELFEKIMEEKKKNIITKEDIKRNIELLKRGSKLDLPLGRLEKLSNCSFKGTVMKGIIKSKQESIEAKHGNMMYLRYKKKGKLHINKEVRLALWFLYYYNRDRKKDGRVWQEGYLQKYGNVLSYIKGHWIKGEGKRLKK